ncbi:hypothetical protein [Mycolicibacterium sp. XJ870]
MSSQEKQPMITADTLRFELEGRLQPLLQDIGKNHLSVRWEPGARIVRVGACIDHYTWETRMLVLEALLKFEEAHADEWALEFDIFPLESVQNEEFAEA